MLRKLKKFYLCLLSAILLILSFPRLELSALAWFSFIPFFWALDGVHPRGAIFLGYLTGVIFFAGTLYWFIHVTLPGAILLVLYLAVYFALFALVYILWSPRKIKAGLEPSDSPPTRERGIQERLFLLPAAWVALEFIRGHLMTGFGWVSLGHSQYKNLGLIQIADLTGMYGVSYIVMMANVFFKELLDFRGNNSPLKKKEIKVSAFIVFCLLIGSQVYSFFQLRDLERPPKIKVAVVQANIPQSMKWNPAFHDSIMERQVILTREAAKERPELVIWPETSFPGYVWESPELFQGLKSFVAGIKIPLLFGLVVRDSSQDSEDYFNSAMLISSHGEVLKRYDKLHLVPFGEYIPLRNVFPFLSGIVPIGDFTAGKKYTLFPASVPIGDRDSVPTHFLNILICFEDTIAELSREFALQGSNLFVNITNDAWFLDTNAPFLHLQASVFRTIENRRGLIRAANTGVSCFINRHGEIFDFVHDRHHRKTYVPGFAVQEIPLNTVQTFYTKYGDIFTYLCFGSILWGMINPKKWRQAHV